MAHFKINEIGDDWLELQFDAPDSVANVFTKEAIAELDTVTKDLESRTNTKGLIFTSAKEKIFIAGADIELIKGLDTLEKAYEGCRTGQQILHRFSKLPFETVAAIDGACLGGGFELALACKKRIASDNSTVKIGLPEVNLGILPGFGGSIRLPRLVALPTALDMILSGKQLNGKRALKAGVVNRVLPKENFRDRAIAWAKENQGKAGRRAKGGAVNSILSTPVGRAYVLSMARKNVLKKTHGHYPAPLKILDLLGKTLTMSLEPALEMEARFFSELAITDISKRLIELFQLSEVSKKTNGVGGKTVKIHKIENGGVLGAGAMGGGIAHAFAKVGCPVRMKDLNHDALALGYNQAAKIFNFSLKRRRISKYDFAAKMALISGTTDYSGFKRMDIVVEAVVENMDVKKKVLAEMEDKVNSDCIIATNTSSLSVTEMSVNCKRPENIGGLHFFNPVNRMPLVEVIQGEKTSEETIASLYAFSKKLGKTPIVVKDGPGFLVNRLLLPYMNEAIFLLEEGVSVDRIDKVMLKFGMPMGPLRLVDEVGIDVAAKVSKILNQAFGVRAQTSDFTQKVATAGRLGKKNGKGFYNWEKGKANGTDESIYELLGSTGNGNSLSDQDLVNRMTFPMINEAAILLKEEIVKTPGEVDLGMIMGTGFPPFRGGILRHADSVGLSEVYSGLEKMCGGKSDQRLTPSSALKDVVDRGKFYL